MQVSRAGYFGLHTTNQWSFCIMAMSIEELRATVSDLHTRVEELRNFLKIDDILQEKADIEAAMSAPDFWDNKDKAQDTVARLSSCRNVLVPFGELEEHTADYEVLLELASEDESMLTEAEPAWHKLEKELDDLELVSFLSGKFDRNNLYLNIHAGAGGTESCDWASMLLRMYRRFFERRGWKDEVIDIQPGDEAGIKSATLRVNGDFAYGYLKGEKGIHRLVRISPFDSNARRHTSFVSVETMPVIDDDINIEVNEADLRIDTYRSSGAGGQHVNTTDSAIRITHIPTGIVVACQAERSQHKNRATAMNMLKAKLYTLEEEKRMNDANALRGEKTDNGWGNQIRSYVLQPYQMVKDLRTGEETSNTSGVLDGEIDDFINSWLKFTGK